MEKCMVYNIVAIFHQITVLSPFDVKSEESSIQHVKIEKIANSVNVYSTFEMRNMTDYELLKLKIDMARDNVDFVLSDEEVMNILQQTEKFQLMILDYNMNEALIG